MTWESLIEAELKKPYFQALVRFLKEEDQTKTIFPIKENRLNAFRLTPFDQVKVVIIGQDPYHDVGQAHGLSFSVESGRFPPSLINIFKELNNDLGYAIPQTGKLTPWAKRGVLLLNSVLTVQAHQPLSHQGKGWETFTEEAIRTLSREREHLVFILWGNQAKQLLASIDQTKHFCITSVHPSPLSASRGFFGSKPFSKANAYLLAQGIEKVDWSL